MNLPAQEKVLRDRFGRVHDYLRVSVTDKCNLRCLYCMPPDGVAPLQHDEVLRNEEFVRLVTVFHGLGVGKFRFTGGEPLVRRGFMEILSGVRRALPDAELCLTTNGLLLEDRLGELCDLGVRKINVSLDTVSPGRFKAVTGSGRHNAVMAALDRAMRMDCFDLKVNAVLFRETLGELEAMLDRFRDSAVTLRFIELMPFAGNGRERFLPAAELTEALARLGTLGRNNEADTRVAVMYDFLYRGAHPMKIGVIPPLSGKFCGRCNRVRLSCDGALRACLHSGALCDLKKLLRDGSGDEAVALAAVRCIEAKPLAHELDCNSLDGACASPLFMSRIGG